MTPDPLTTWLLRPMSWSQLSCWQFDKTRNEWFNRYILNQKSPETSALLFGKAFADSCEARTPLAPVTLYSVIEHPMEAVLGDIPLVGYADTYEPAQRLLGEFKTGAKAWDQKRVDTHGQLTFYTLLLWLIDKTRPEDVGIMLQWLPVVTTPQFTLDFKRDTDGNPTIHTFNTTRTMADALRLGKEIQETRNEMEAYALTRLT